ncbi:type II toxin-antitoxin system HicB family antitoxin [Catenulispora rubra]|uniref:type II toxin-antitoxin system HicB family antitoxin n=1 Tax=Catenulispora rubra TaxID=280293 RepID=UPI00189261CB|nr:type II toxin-antitoxin system HicB family antitoxin [Catenulispora rubra]
MTGPATPETYRAIAEPDGDWWVVTVPDLPGVHTQGRNREQARNTARDAIATMLGTDAERVTITMDFRGSERSGDSG